MALYGRNGGTSSIPAFLYSIRLVKCLCELIKHQRKNNADIYAFSMVECAEAFVKILDEHASAKSVFRLEEEVCAQLNYH
jgi:hypothetical protein